MNILFTCAGRRNYLINYFKEALKNKGKIIAADYQLSAPAMVDADMAIKVPKIYDPNYISTLKQIVKKHGVNAIISLNDLELPVLCKAKEELESLGTKVLISDEKIINIAFDKWETYTFFKNINVKTPETFLNLTDARKAIDEGRLKFPLIVKPRWGSASIGIDVVENMKELELSHQLQLIKIRKSILNEASLNDIDKSILIQEKIDGDEYGIDLLNDFNGNYYNSYIRKKLTMRSGETDKAISVTNPVFSDIAEKIARRTKHIGNMDCDFFVTKNNEVYFLEMNPRFGGGYPFSHEAGVNTPAIYIAWLHNEHDVDKYDDFKPGLAFSKCDRLIPILNM